MEISKFIAQLLGVMYSVVGIGFFLNQKYYEKSFKKLLASPVVPYFGGVMALVVGYVIVFFHNLWVKDWAVLVTVVGWLALLKGFLYLIAPEFTIDLANKWIKKMNLGLVSVLVFALGLVFVYFGFFA